MIRRVGDPEAVSGIDALCVWRVPLSEAPGRQWRHAFLEHARTLGIFHDAGLRLAEGTIFLQLDRGQLRSATEHLDGCIAEANAACGLAQDDTDSDVAPSGRPVILVVDDQSAIVATVGGMLARQGYHVLKATDPRDALQIAESRRVDLLLTDVVMPVMNGPELARRVLETSPRTRTLFMSAYAVEEVLARATPLLSKPFSYDTLAAAIRDALERPSPFRRSAPAAPSPLSR